MPRQKVILNMDKCKDADEEPGIKNLHRFFLTFPDGTSGLGLLLLRITIGTTLLLKGFAHLFEKSIPEIWAWFLGAALIVCGVSLITGFLTPVSAILVCLGSISFAVLPAAPANNINLPTAIYVTAISAAVIMLGPGAFSLDAKMFGRREIIIPEKSKSPKS